MVGQICAMVVLPLTVNSFQGTVLLDRTVRVLTLDFKTPELSAEKLEKRFPEVLSASWALSGLSVA
jgi:hypothetical protein